LDSQRARKSGIVVILFILLWTGSGEKSPQRTPSDGLQKPTETGRATNFLWCTQIRSVEGEPLLTGLWRLQILRDGSFRGREIPNTQILARSYETGDTCHQHPFHAE
jgi:hypothetical protein